MNFGAARVPDTSIGAITGAHFPDGTPGLVVALLDLDVLYTLDRPPDRALRQPDGAPPWLLGYLAALPAECFVGSREALSVTASVARRGWGPALYDFAIASAGAAGLTPDRGDVSEGAAGIWRRYREARPDVSSAPISGRGCGVYRGGTHGALLNRAYTLPKMAPAQIDMRARGHEATAALADRWDWQSAAGVEALIFAFGGGMFDYAHNRGAPPPALRGLNRPGQPL